MQQLPRLGPDDRQKKFHPHRFDAPQKAAAPSDAQTRQITLRETFFIFA
jgi:hypothetical protein